MRVLLATPLRHLVRPRASQLGHRCCASASAAVAEAASTSPLDVAATPVAPKHSLPQLHCSLRQLKENSRKQGGTSSSRRLRREGYVPAVIFGSDTHGNKERLLIQVPKAGLDKLMREERRAFQGTVYEACVQGRRKGIQVIPHQVQWHATKHEVINIAFLRYKAGRSVSVPIEFINEDLCPVLKRGAFVLKLETRLNVTTDSDDPTMIPKALEVDLEGVPFGSKLRVSDINFPEGVRPFNEEQPFAGGTLIAVIHGRGRNQDEETEGEEAAASG